MHRSHHNWQMVKEVNANTPNVGDVVTFTITVTNDGPNDATGITVVDVIPNGYINISNIIAGGILTGNLITWDNIDLVNGASEVLTFDAEVIAPATGIDYKNVAQVTTLDQTDSDSSPGNDDGDQSEDDEDSAELIPQLVDVHLTKEVNNPTPDMGAVVTFTIRVGNDGPNDASNLEIQDSIPNGYTNITNISSAGTLAGSVITWNLASLPSGASEELTFEAEVVVPDSGIDYLNIAQVTAMDQEDIDSTPANDDGDQSEDDEDSAIVTPTFIMSIGSTVFKDENNNGSQDVQDAGIAGVTVELYNGTGVMLNSTVTDVDGNYLFDGLAPGEYMVRIPTPDPVYNTSSTYDGGDDQIDGDDNGLQDAPGTSTTSAVITLAAGSEPTTEPGQGGTLDDIEDAQGDMTIDFGFYSQASIGNFVWFDVNGNGLQDIGDPGLDGVTISLLDIEGNILESTTTDGNGNYIFDGLAPGEYVVQFITPNAFTPVLSDANGISAETSDCNCANEDPIDNDADAITGLTHIIRLESGEIEDEVDAGFNLILDVELLSFSGRYVEDRNVVTLEWITSNEIKNDYFEVQRAQENGKFVSIGRVEAVGNSTVETFYDLDDEDIQYTGIYLYRLKQVDDDGSEEYSDVISVNVRKISKVEPAVSLYPNPTSDHVNIDIIKNLEDKVSIEMFDLAGKIVTITDMEVQATLIIPVDELPSATYIIRIQVGKEIFAKKLTVAN